MYLIVQTLSSLEERSYSLSEFFILHSCIKEPSTPEDLLTGLIDSVFCHKISEPSKMAMHYVSNGCSNTEFGTLVKPLHFASFHADTD